MKIAIANRGEVAVRIIKACQEMGYKTVLLHSEVDESSRAFRLADESVCIGPAESSLSYLSIENNINAAKSVGADAIHPGFGFLSENASFAKACIDNGLIFIGPKAESIRLFGDKISAKKLVSQIGDYLVPGYQGEDQSVDVLKKKAEEIGFPMVVKAADGGGGRGIKVAWNSSEVESAIESAKREAFAAFGSDKVFLEKYLHKAKHIEVQIFVDAAGGAYHLGERECSVQRRHQKVIEESPSFLLEESLRKKLLQVAIEIAKKSNYRGAGTVEFLVQEGQFYFLEMNTRLQVEHTVTEMVYGVDLVKAQLNTAFGNHLGWSQDELASRGHSIECRLYAEDPYQNGVPSLGVLGYCQFPNGPGRRFEYGFESGDEITPYYDSMIAKIIVWDENRPRAIKKMLKTLEETIIFGVKTNIPFLKEMLIHPEFIDGVMTTQFINKYFENGLDLSVREDGLDADSLKKLFKQSSHVVKNDDYRKLSDYDHFHPNPWLNIWERNL